MKKQHSIDFIFPIALFFVFASTALIVLLATSNIYQNITETSEASFQQSTTLSYISEKIRQNNSVDGENIYLCKFDGCDALAIAQDYNDISYVTYIYELDGDLKELFIQKGITASAQTGTTILQIQKLQMKELSDGLFQFTCTSSDNTSDSIIISTR